MTEGPLRRSCSSASRGRERDVACVCVHALRARPSRIVRYLLSCVFVMPLSLAPVPVPSARSDCE